MGLAGPRKRRKIGNDPNNTTWSRDEEGFGHKILSAQGWVPGSYLGAVNAAHSSHYTSANASHIRAVLKDDTRGLGSKPTYSEGDNFGLGSFQDLLGRLNGKAEKEIEKSQQIRADLGLKHYVGQRYGASSFVRGGYLVGDRITDSKPTATKVSSVIEDHADVETTAIKRGTDRKKHKNHESTTDKAVVETKQERRERKAQRRSEKAERRLKKESKSKVGVDSEANSDAFDTDNTDSVESTSKMAIKEVSPMGWAVAGGLGGRQAVRQRFIRQKKMASMDPQALKEILMVKG